MPKRHRWPLVTASALPAPSTVLIPHHGRRLGQQAVGLELDRSAAAAGLDISPHQLRHTYATALVHTGLSLQALMALLGHVSAQMTLRYGQLFDTTVRSEYERTLELAKQHAHPLTRWDAAKPHIKGVEGLKLKQ